MRLQQSLRGLAAAIALSSCGNQGQLVDRAHAAIEELRTTCSSTIQKGVRIAVNDPNTIRFEQTGAAGVKNTCECTDSGATRSCHSISTDAGGETLLESLAEAKPGTKDGTTRMNFSETQLTSGVPIDTTRPAFTAVEASQGDCTIAAVDDRK